MQMNYFLIKLQKYPDTYDSSPGFECRYTYTKNKNKKNKTTYGLSEVCLTILPEKKVAYLEPSKLQIVQKWHIDEWPHFSKNLLLKSYGHGCVYILVHPIKKL